MKSVHEVDNELARSLEAVIPINGTSYSIKTQYLHHMFTSVITGGDSDLVNTAVLAYASGLGSRFHSCVVENKSIILKQWDQSL